MSNALEIEGLTKIYGDGFEALKGIDLHVAEGDFFALLGPNGAGKSTTLGIVCSLINKTAGKVRVFGCDIDTHLSDAKLNLGVVPQEFNFNQFEKVFDIVTTQAGYYGIPLKQASVSAEKYLKKLGLWGKRDTPARMLSGGMKRRLMIARALVHEPKLLILDEPTAGVDIELRRSMWTFLEEMNRQGTTIILTTHTSTEDDAYLRRRRRFAATLPLLTTARSSSTPAKRPCFSSLALRPSCWIPSHRWMPRPCWVISTPGWTGKVPWRLRWRKARG